MSKSKLNPDAAVWWPLKSIEEDKCLENECEIKVVIRFYL